MRADLGIQVALVQVHDRPGDVHPVSVQLILRLQGETVGVVLRTDVLHHQQSFPGFLELAVAGEAVLLHRKHLTVNADLVVERLAHGREKDGRATVPERRVAAPHILPAFPDQAHQLRAMRSDFDG